MTWPDMSPFFDVMCYVRFSFKVGGTAVVSLAGWTPRGGSSNVLYGGEALVGNVAASTVGANAYTATSAVGWVTFTVAFGVPASASDRFFQFL